MTSEQTDKTDKPETAFIEYQTLMESLDYIYLHKARLATMPTYTRLFNVVDECSSKELDKLEHANAGADFASLTKDKQKRLNLLRKAQYELEYQHLKRNVFDEHDNDKNKQLDDNFNDEFHDKHGWLPEDAQTAYDKRHRKGLLN